jgi:D-alanine-D-alanine ligase
MKTCSKKIKVALITGGWSSERDISLRSAKSVLGALERIGKYEVCEIDYQKNLLKFAHDLDEAKPDVALLAIHGLGAEDGTLQGALELSGIRYTSSSVTASALVMDKVFSRMILEGVGIKFPEWELLPIKVLAESGARFSFPYVVKPRNEGSSVGVSIVHSEQDLKKVVSEWTFGENVLVEKYISGKEIQVAVLFRRAIGAMEIKPNTEFFDYHAKYTSGATEHIIPPNIPSQICDEILQISQLAVDVLGCDYIVRPEFIYGDDGEIYCLELNTQPGMTDLSIVPDIAKHYGISYDEIIEAMVENALASCSCAKSPDGTCCGRENGELKNNSAA